MQAYAQKNPLNEYKVEAFRIFEDMMDGVRRTITTAIMHLSIPDEILHPERYEQLHSDEDNRLNTDINGSNSEKEEILITTDVPEQQPIPSRNSICPCGSGLRYKDCCGKIEDISFSLTDIKTASEVNPLDSNNIQLDDAITQVESEHNDITPQDILEHFAQDQRDAVLNPADLPKTVSKSRSRLGTQQKKITRKDDVAKKKLVNHDGVKAIKSQNSITPKKRLKETNNQTKGNVEREKPAVINKTTKEQAKGVKLSAVEKDIKSVTKRKNVRTTTLPVFSS